MLGNCVIGSRLKDWMPISNNTANNSTGPTGLRIDQAEKFQFMMYP